MLGLSESPWTAGQYQGPGVASSFESVVKPPLIRTPCTWRQRDRSGYVGCRVGGCRGSLLCDERRRNIRDEATLRLSIREVIRTAKADLIPVQSPRGNMPFEDAISEQLRLLRPRPAHRPARHPAARRRLCALSGVGLCVPGAWQRRWPFGPRPKRRASRTPSSLAAKPWSGLHARRCSLRKCR